ncbi:hypothetical protein ANOM_008971 [Aspergillus nomiae NRRL 13137]|uniref:magnesium chelatase n=1 Tax=Aspergillus nomiae NRRL (strain ATCC 15546 / NRRL 13137 / CBS 260.88 / M93) TaxID=1509407 RepID=A0A0L1IQF9_ASPN3|nr:uncharacterized protein ANOM_008971 [Aspergillus nomiae NRRL 13137]KNG81719.1 hypothetical protein ANOM_008971 [Aspergillus nomiae NRRL 13137]
MDDLAEISSLVLELSDLEVALYLCLAAREHCRIDATADNINDVATELALICVHTFGLTCTTVDCSETTTLDEFCSELILANARNSTGPNNAENRTANVVVAKNFDRAADKIQLQALELMSSKKLNTYNGFLEAPEEFLFIPLVMRKTEHDQPALNFHLNDRLIISYFHGSRDDFIYLEENNDWLSDGQMSASSVVRKSEVPLHKGHLSIDRKALDKLQKASDCVTMGADVVRYHQDITVFLRLSRAVAGGISARSNVYFRKISKLLAVLHGIDYLTPSIVALAAKKVFRHRIIVAKPEDDRSLQYGSDLKTVAQVLSYATPDTILDSVLTLEAPL